MTNSDGSDFTPAKSDASSENGNRHKSVDRQSNSQSIAQKGGTEANQVIGENQKAAINCEPDGGTGIIDGKSGKQKRNKRRRSRRRKAKLTGALLPTSSTLNPPAVSVAVAETPNVMASNRIATSNAYAALDLGTNNCRLLVAVPTRPGNFRVIDAFSRIVRLGEGFGASGRLSEVAMDRAVEALKVCRDKLYSRPITKARLIATEACRSAENGDEFLHRVKDETGLTLEIVDRETEARLAVSGCSSLVDRSAKFVVLFDIGGGSSEIALVKAADYHGGRLADHIHAWTSLPIGVVTMAEKFGGRDVTPDQFNAMVAHATELLLHHSDDALRASMVGGKACVTNNDFHLIGTSGTVTTLAGIHLDLPRYDRRRVDGLWMSSLQVDKINKQLLDWSFDERAANMCIGNDRADLVLAGCAILEAIRKVWPTNRLRVADRGLREGLLTEMMASDGVWRRRQRSPSANRGGKG